jgi:tRNA-intron endonuclease
MGKTAVAQGQMAGAHVVVGDAGQANRLHNRHGVGDPQRGNSLRLSRVEAAWLAATDRLEVVGPGGARTVAALLQADKRAQGAATEVEFLVYSDLRERGLLVRHDGPRLAVWGRGLGIADKPSYHVVPSAEREPVLARSIAAWAAAGDVAAVVDEDGAVTHYGCAFEGLAGDCPASALSAAGAEVLADRVLVSDAAAGAWHEHEFLGTPTQGGLVLSFTEAESLRRRGILQIPDSLAKHARAAQPRFDAILAAYEALRARGVIAKSGFKFGTHLRGYRANPDEAHAEWLIQCAEPAEEIPWSDLSRAIRVAHGVRKRFVLAIPDGGALQFARMSWFKP